jgi:nucleoid-associated protein YgaU
MSIFDITDPKEKAKAALSAAEKAKGDQYAKGAIDAMNAALAATHAKQASDQQAKQVADLQKQLEAVTAAAANAAKWKQQEETIEEALEHAGISGIDIQIDDKGYAKVLGTVTSDGDRDTAVAMVEQFPVTGMEVSVDVVAPPPQEAAPATGNYTVKAGESWWGIAARTYGDGTLWKALKAANNNPRMIHPGTVIVLPSKDDLKK